MHPLARLDGARLADGGLYLTIGSPAHRAFDRLSVAEQDALGPVWFEYAIREPEIRESVFEREHPAAVRDPSPVVGRVGAVHRGPTRERRRGPVRRRGSRRATGSGSRAGPSSDDDEPASHDVARRRLAREWAR
jgi:hypothetical protein